MMFSLLHFSSFLGTSYLASAAHRRATSSSFFFFVTEWKPQYSNKRKNCQIKSKYSSLSKQIPIPTHTYVGLSRSIFSNRPCQLSPLQVRKQTSVQSNTTSSPIQLALPSLLHHSSKRGVVLTLFLCVVLVFWVKMHLSNILTFAESCVAKHSPPNSNATMDPPVRFVP
jgi:hypothetical protein